MDNEPATVPADDQQTAPAAGGGAPRRSFTSRWWVRVIVGVVLVIALGAATDALTASPRVCASCHEITARAGTWSRSAHVGVPCVSCHQTPRPWYAMPLRLVDRAVLLGRDVAKHVAGGYRDPVDSRVVGAPTRDAVCLQCHDPNRKATSGFRILIDHPAHAKRNGSCVSCHVRTAHPLPTRGAALSLMTQCFTCHGNAATAKAPGRCALCHPEGYRLVPTSHTTAKWRRGGHGAIAKLDLKLCEMCHNRRTCDGCHGIDMPHPAGWSATGHGPVATLNPSVCRVCHQAGPDFCTKCHHKTYDPTKG